MPIRLRALSPDDLQLRPLNIEYNNEQVNFIQPFSPIQSPSFTMPRQVAAYGFSVAGSDNIDGALDNDARFVEILSRKVVVEMPELKSDYVEIEISHSFVKPASSNLTSQYQQIDQANLAVNSMVGKITRLGKSVKHLVLGQKVAVGQLVEACMGEKAEPNDRNSSAGFNSNSRCRACLSGNDAFCPYRKLYNDTHSNIVQCSPINPQHMVLSDAAHGISETHSVAYHCQSIRVQGYMAIPLPDNMSMYDACLQIALSLPAYSCLSRNNLLQSSCSIGLVVSQSDSRWPYILTWMKKDRSFSRKITLICYERNFYEFVCDLFRDNEDLADDIWLVTSEETPQQLQTYTSTIDSLDVVITSLSLEQKMKNSVTVFLLENNINFFGKILSLDGDNMSEQNMTRLSHKQLRVLFEKSISVSFNSNISNSKDARNLFNEYPVLPSYLDNFKPQVVSLDDITGSHDTQLDKKSLGFVLQFDN